MISIAMPCYNAAKFLPETLRAILDQSYGDFELIVVDDGSTDDSAAVVAAAGDPRVRLVRTPPSGGPSRPRNRAVAEARGSHVFFCDADDVMLPGKLAAQMELFAARPELGLVFTNFRIVDSEGCVVQPDFVADYHAFREMCPCGDDGVALPTPPVFYRALLRGNVVGTSSVAVRRDVLQDVGGFDETLASSEDNDLWLRIARRYPCGYLERVGHSYRRHAASVMRQVDARHPQARITVLRRQLPFLEDEASRRAVLERIVVNHLGAGLIQLRAGDAAAARCSYGAAMRLRPSLAAARGLGRSLLGGRLLRAWYGRRIADHPDRV